MGKGEGYNLDASDQEFLRALHEEKVTAQKERSDYVTRKMAFVTVLFGLSSLDLGIRISFAEIYWLLYFIPLVSICYDSYIMSADARVKRIGAFLGRHPKSVAGDVEKQWEHFSTMYRSAFAPFTDMFLSILVTLAAAIYLYSQQHPVVGNVRILFAAWMVISQTIIVGLWIKHRYLIREIDRYNPAAELSFAMF
jgi:hypothetical protein